MNHLPIYNQIFIVFINLIAISLAITVNSNNRKGKLNQIFLWMTLFMLFWVNFAFLARVVGKSNLLLAKNFLHISWFVTPLFILSLYILIINLIEETKKYKNTTIIVSIIAIGLSILTGFTNWVVAGTKFVDNILRIVYGPGMVPFLMGLSFITIATIYALFKNYINIDFKKKKKIEYFIVGVSIFYIANIIFNITLPFFFDIARFYFIGDYSTIFLLSFSAYAIIKEELFGIRVALTQALIIIIAIILLSQAIISDSLFNLIWNLLVFSFFSFFGYSLSKSITKEIKQKEELEKLTKKLEENNEKLLKLDKVKTEFISIASHQLRTPLTAIKGYISMIAEGTYGKVPKEARGKLENVALSNERLIKLVNDLLSVSRIETGKIELDPKKENLERVVIQIIDELKINAEKKGLYLEFKKPKKKLPEIMLDEGKLRQVILNLIDNSIKYTLEGGITVSLDRSENEKDAVIKMVDTGEGMDEEELSKVFASFSRGQAGNQLSTEGAGLGLFIARKFIEMHGGKVWAESEGKKKGTQFYIQLPIK